MTCVSATHWEEPLVEYCPVMIIFDCVILQIMQ